MTWRKVFDAPLTDASRRVDEASRGFDASRPILRTSSKNTPKASACPSKTISAPHAFRRPSSRAFSFPRRFSSSSPSCRRTPSTSPSRSSSSATAGPGTGTKSSRRSSTGFRSSCPPSLRRCFSSVSPSCSPRAAGFSRRRPRDAHSTSSSQWVPVPPQSGGSRARRASRAPGRSSPSAAPFR